MALAWQEGLCGGDAGVSAHARDKPLMLAVAAVNFTHKVAAAAVFGVWGCSLRSWTQLVLLACFQVGGYGVAFGYGYGFFFILV